VIFIQLRAYNQNGYNDPRAARIALGHNNNKKRREKRKEKKSTRVLFLSAMLKIVLG
jgi:hypothetical protein